MWLINNDMEHKNRCKSASWNFQSNQQHVICRLGLPVSNVAMTRTVSNAALRVIVVELYFRNLSVTLTSKRNSVLLHLALALSSSSIASSASQSPHQWPASCSSNANLPTRRQLKSSVIVFVFCYLSTCLRQYILTGTSYAMTITFDRINLMWIYWHSLHYNFVSLIQDIHRVSEKRASILFLISSVSVVQS